MENTKCPFCGCDTSIRKITDLYPQTKNKYSVLVCNNFFNGTCDAYIKVVPVGDTYVPSGTMANSKLRSKRMELSEELYKIWKGKFINKINPDFILRYVNDDKFSFAKRISQDGDFVVIEDIFTAERFEVPKTNTITVPSRTKTYITLALEMKKPFELCSPSHFNYEETIAALNIVQKWWTKIIS